MAIFDEQVLEPFVARGVGNSGVASRQIQAGNLPDLSAAVRQSVVTQQNLDEQRTNALKAEQMVNISKLLQNKPVASDGSVNIGEMNRPFVIGRIKGGQYTAGGYTVAIPDGRGSFELKTLYTDPSLGGASDENLRARSVLKEMGIDTGKNYPELGISGLGGKYNKADLSSVLMTYAKPNSENGISLSDILKRVG